MQSGPESRGMQFARTSYCQDFEHKCLPARVLICRKIGSVEGPGRSKWALQVEDAVRMRSGRSGAVGEVERKTIGELDLRPVFDRDSPAGWVWSTPNSATREFGGESGT